jgi:hypothetical protein
MLAVTGERRLLLEGGRSVRFWWALPSPDGHYAALEELTGENNIWMIENFSGHGFVAPVSTRFDMGPFNSGYILPTKCITTFSLVEKSPMRISSAAVLESALTVIGVLPAHFQCHLAGCKVSGMEDPGPGSSPW